MKNESGIRLEGITEEALPGLLFRIKLDAKNPLTEKNREVLAYLGGRMKLNRIKVIPGDRVVIEMPNLEAERGRIIKRL